MHISRRNLLSTAALIPVAACGLVTSNTTNGVTSLTIDVAKIDAYGQAFANGAAVIALLPGVAGTTPGNVIASLAPVVKADLAKFDASVGGSLSLTFNSGSVPAAVQSVLADGQTLLSAAGTITGLNSGIATTVQLYIDSIGTLVSLFQGAVSGTASAALAPKMTEGQALANLGVK